MATIVDAVVVNYGCPRSGTTWMEKCLGQLTGSVCAFKLAEGRILHPCQSEDGLIELAKILRFKRLAIIRTVRHPLEIAESFVAMRSLGGKGALKKFTDPRAVEFIRSESSRTATQRAELKHSDWEHRGRCFIEVQYERMHELEYRQDFARHLVEDLPERKENERLMLQAVEGFGVRPIRMGRLAAGLGRVMSPEQREWFRTELADVIRREGYADQPDDEMEE